VATKAGARNAPPAERKVSFGKGNAKLDAATLTFSLPAGWTCPGASACLARVDPGTGKLTDGPATVFRCFSASQEALYRNVRDARWRNFDALRAASSRQGMAALLLGSLPAHAKAVRIHVSGDFFSQAYFDAWCDVATARPATLFYAYTKSVHYWHKRAGSIPANLRLTASEGGRHDATAKAGRLRTARVVFTEADAGRLPIDHDDSHARGTGGNFALLLHGAQPKGSAASRAMAALRATGWNGYGNA
jgi:hypothetical protein